MSYYRFDLCRIGGCAGIGVQAGQVGVGPLHRLHCGGAVVHGLNDLRSYLNRVGRYLLLFYSQKLWAKFLKCYELFIEFPGVYILNL